MADDGMARRGALRAFGALVAGAAAAGLARPAQAFRVLDGNDLRAVLDEGCGATAYHRRVLAETAATLGTELTPERRRAVLAAMPCPTCGCNLVQAAAGLDESASF